MSEKNAKLIRRTVEWLTTVATVVVGVCFIVACINVYGGEKGNFTRLAVIEELGKISVFIYFWLFLIVLGVALGCFIPFKSKSAYPRLFTDSALKRARAMLDMSKVEAEAAEKLNKEIKRRRAYGFICYGLLFAGAVAFAVYAANGDNFAKDGEEYTNTVVNTAIFALLCVTPSVMAFFALLPFVRRSGERERAVLTELIKQGTALAAPSVSTCGKGTVILNVIRATLIALGIALVLLGIFGGGVEAVFAKAVKLCTECVGLG